MEGSLLVAHIESRRSDDGTLTYRAKVRLKGHKAESTTFTRLTDARRWAQATEAEPPRFLRRLQLLRRWSHEQVNEVLT